MKFELFILEPRSEYLNLVFSFLTAALFTFVTAGLAGYILEWSSIGVQVHRFVDIPWQAWT